MKETAEQKTKFVSPPPVVAMWGDTSPLLVGNHSQAGNILHKSTMPSLISGANQVESKAIAEGFLSEVSTPDCGSKDGQEGPSSAENKECPFVSKLSPSKLLPASYRELDVIEECKTAAAYRDLLVNEECNSDRTTLPITTNKFEDKVEENPQDSHRSPAISKFDPNLKEEDKRIDCIKSAAHAGNVVPFPVDDKQKTAPALKRKRLSVNEEKAERKRLKVSASEGSRGKGSAQWSHLSEEELKKLRRVKNRESVEKCRTKQRLRMEALQVEQTCLRLENKNLREAIVLIHAALDDVSMQMAQLNDHTQSSAEKETVEKMEEMRTEMRTGVQA